MLDEQRANVVLEQLKTFDIETRLKAIQDAREMFATAFSDGMSNKDYAYSALVVEQYYNLIREMLRVKQIRVKADGSVHDTENKTKPKPKTPKVEAPKMDLAGMMAAFAAFKQESKG